MTLQELASNAGSRRSAASAGVAPLGSARAAPGTISLANSHASRVIPDPLHPGKTLKPVFTYLEFAKVEDRYLSQMKNYREEVKVHEEKIARCHEFFLTMFSDTVRALVDDLLDSNEFRPAWELIESNVKETRTLQC